MYRKLLCTLSILALESALAFGQGPAPALLPTLTPPPNAAAKVTIADPVSNQQLARAVAQALQGSGKLHGYRLDIQVAQGEVELFGRVADLAQKEEAVRLAHAVTGVTRVRDLVHVGGEGAIIVVQNVPELGPPPKKSADPAPPATDAPVVPMPPMLPNCGPGYMGQGCPFPNEPLPIGPSVPNDIFQKPPPLPPYAWPTFAPYNNYSRVAYPLLYPNDAWPGIGPFYPFPKVPTGWRSVTLSWQDGYWWYGRGVSGHDWWRVRYK